MFSKCNGYIYLLAGLVMLTISRVLYSILSFMDVLTWNDYLFIHKMAVIEYGSYVMIFIFILIHIKKRKEK